MRLALQEKLFQLFYQPKITLGATAADHRLAACEALIRWPHPQWGYVSPAEFIPIAETTGLINPIDDFGTGYSSLSYLRRFEVDSIKIDKSFVDAIGRDPNADAICDAIIGLSHSLGKRVVAEGVETEEQLAFLKAKGCKEIQGYLFGRPEPAPEFVRKLVRRD